jgi:hypothetical protein
MRKKVPRGSERRQLAQELTTVRGASISQACRVAGIVPLPAQKIP